MSSPATPAYLVIRYRNPDHPLRTVIYEWHGENPGAKAASAEKQWQASPRVRDLAEVHVRRAENLFLLLAENEVLFQDREAVAG